MASHQIAFPLSRFSHYRTRYYYAFGNTPAENFLRSVAADPATSTRPQILSLGCGDIRSCMYTLWKKKEEVSVAGVDFVLNDCNAAVLARNVLFLHLCLYMPEDGDSQARKKLVARVWSIWYNHELTSEHSEDLRGALGNLKKWSETSETWSQCHLRNVHFSSATLTAVREVWIRWENWMAQGGPMSVEEMKQARKVVQEEKRKCRTLGTSEERVFETMAGNQTHPQNTLDTMTKEYSAFLQDGYIFVEDVLGLSTPRDENSLNVTLFEQPDGSYTLQYELVPYIAFHHDTFYTQNKVGDMDEAIVLVADEHFKKAPLLANSVQQFTMWLTATAKMMKQSGNCKVSFTFDCSDAIGFCQSLFQFPNSHNLASLKPPFKFDAIYTSNLLDHISATPAFIIVTTILLKPEGKLFTTRFQNEPTMSTIEKMFGFSCEKLGIKCDEEPGRFNPGSREHLMWHNVALKPIDKSQLMNDLCKSCISATQHFHAFDSFLAIVHHFKTRLPAPVSYHFWAPFCQQFVNEYEEKKLVNPVAQLQTQCLLHGIHMHFIYTNSTCPLCTNKSLSEYIVGYTVCFKKRNTDMTFVLQLHNDKEYVCTTSVAGSSRGQNIELDFFLLINNELDELKSYRVFGTSSEQPKVDFAKDKPIKEGERQELNRCPLDKYFFLKEMPLPASIPTTSVSSEYSCAMCGKPNSRRCCESVAYCSKECQKLAWKSHKTSCTNKRRKKPASR